MSFSGEKTKKIYGAVFGAALHLKRHTLKSETPRRVRVLQINHTSNDKCPSYVLGAPSHVPMEYRDEAAVVSRGHRMK